MQIFEQKDIRIDLPVMIDTRSLICANSGGGKSYLVRKLLEATADKVLSIVLDIEGEFKTIREKFDFLLIGPNGDVELNQKAVKMLPRKLLELNVSTIIDISDLKRHERIMYVKHFLEALMELPRKLWQPTQIFLDEAHSLCGQQEKQESCAAVIDLMTRGRKRGYEGILATQRISKLHKDAAAECNNIFIGRTGLDIDMKRASEILGFTSKQDMLSLRDLEPGEFFVFGPAISRHVIKAKVAPVVTRHPKVGMDLRRDIVPPTPKIKAILEKINDLPKEAEQKVQTEKELRQRVRQLEIELKKKPEAEVKVIDNQKAIEAAHRQGLIEGQKQYAAVKKEYQYVVNQLEQIGKIVTGFKAKVAETVENIEYAEQKPVKVKPVIAPAANAAVEGDINLNRCARSILSLLYNNPQRGFTKILIGLFTGYSHKSGGFNNALAQLNTAGLITRGNEISISDDGEAQAPVLLGSDVDLHEQFTIDNWANKLPKCASLIFQFLKENPCEEFTKEEIGERTGYQSGSGGFNNALSKLNRLGLTTRLNGRVKLNEEILAGIS